MHFVDIVILRTRKREKPVKPGLVRRVEEDEL